VKEFNTAAIYITHDLAVVAQLADRIKVLRFGEEVEEATTLQMLSAPREDYTKSLWSVRSLHKEPNPSEDIVLDIKNIHAAYGKKVKVIHDVLIRLPRGRTVSIVGESGSGKSTMARVITGLLPAMEGEVQFNGKVLPREMKNRSHDQLRKIQMIYQMADTAMNPRQTVGEIIGRPFEFYQGLKGRVKEAHVVGLLELIELDETFYDRLQVNFPGNKNSAFVLRVPWSRTLRLLSVMR